MNEISGNPYPNHFAENADVLKEVYGDLLEVRRTLPFLPEVSQERQWLYADSMILGVMQRLHEIAGDPSQYDVIMQGDGDTFERYARILAADCKTTLREQFGARHHTW